MVSGERKRIEDECKDIFRSHISEHGINDDITYENGKRQLLVNLRSRYDGSNVKVPNGYRITATERQIRTSVKTLSNKVRGVIRPERTNRANRIRRRGALGHFTNEEVKIARGIDSDARTEQQQFVVDRAQDRTKAVNEEVKIARRTPSASRSQKQQDLVDRAAAFNDLNNKMRQEESLKANLEFLQEHHAEIWNQILTPAELDVELQVVLTTPYPKLGNRSIERCLNEDPSFLFYFGITSQHPITKETYRFLTARGANTEAGRTRGQRNRPVLRWKATPTQPRRTVTMIEATDVLGFDAFPLREFTAALNSTSLERKLQEYTHFERRIPLGAGRLNRHPAKGANYADRVGKWTVFCSFTFVDVFALGVQMVH